MEQQKFWDSKWSKYNSGLAATNYAKNSLSFLKKTNCKTLLDLGCGDGKDSIYFAKNGFSVTAIDFSNEAIKILKKEIENKKNLNIQTKISDIKNLKLNKKFDVIYSNLSLHYFDDKDTKKIFNDLKKYLNNEGIIFIRVKSVDDSLAEIGIKHSDNFYKINKKNQRLFSKTTLIYYLSGYRILKIRKNSSILMSLVYDKPIKSHFIEATAKKIS